MLATLPLAFVDLETTGTHAAGDAITEIGVVRVDPAGDGTARVTEWSSLVHPRRADTAGDTGAHRHHR